MTCLFLKDGEGMSAKIGRLQNQNNAPKSGVRPSPMESLGRALCACVLNSTQALSLNIQAHFVIILAVSSA